jgi:malonyl-CoA O-methyltransferase
MAGPLDKARLRTAFAAAAARYERHDRWHQAVAEELMAHLEPVRLSPSWILDVGSGIGTCSRLLAKRYPRARVVAVDFVPAMVRAAREGSKRWFSRQGFLCGDAEALPVADASVDLLVSSLMLPYCLPPDRSFHEFCRVLRPGGLLLFSSLGPDTLKELRESWAMADGHDRVHHFMDMHDVGDALVRCGFADVVMDCERGVTHYADVTALMGDLRGLGGAHAIAGRSRGLTGKGRLRAMANAYEGHRGSAGLPASYEIVFGHAWRPGQRPVQVTLTALDPAHGRGPRV